MLLRSSHTFTQAAYKRGSGLYLNPAQISCGKQWKRCPIHPPLLLPSPFPSLLAPCPLLLLLSSPIFPSCLLLPLFSTPSQTSSTSPPSLNQSWTNQLCVLSFQTPGPWLFAELSLAHLNKVWEHKQSPVMWVKLANSAFKSSVFVEGGYACRKNLI